MAENRLVYDGWTCEDVTGKDNEGSEPVYVVQLNTREETQEIEWALSLSRG